MTQSVMQEFQVVLDIVATDAMATDDLEAIADAVLDEVETKAAFVAMGPVVSVDFSRQAIEIECHVSGETPEQVYTKMSRITGVMLEAANSFSYEGSSARKLEPVLA
jgi:hypothetical protein